MFFTSEIFAAHYKISKITYEITGMLSTIELEKSVPIDYETVFEDENELEKYIEYLNQSYKNLRVFEFFSIEAEPFDKLREREESREREEVRDSMYEDEVCGPILINIKLSGKVSWHFLALPYIKYTSSDGMSIKLKAKDSNFFGTLSVFTASLDLNIIPKDEYSSFWDEPQWQPLLNMSYNFPFSIGKVNMTWLNNYTLKYTVGDATPEWNFLTGLNANIPVTNNFSVNMEADQGAYKNFDYEKFGDATYFTENFSVSTPIIVARLPINANVTLTPSTSFAYTWDADGISQANSDLLNPSLNVGLGSGISKINWLENFKNGFSSSISTSVSYNFPKNQWSPSLTFNAAGYKSFGFGALYSRMKIFAYYNGSSKFDADLRGIRDNQKIADTASYACQTSSAIVMNIDFPVKIFRTHWENWPVTRKIGFMRNFNFEFQLSLFFDFAFIYSPVTKTTFHPKDAFYSAGLEALIFPQKWTDFQLRFSFGVDLGRTLFKDILDMSWRDPNISPFEISIGLGLLY